ncbi:MAG TPA: hypothetical protein VK463_15920 [Desulfomonilaceae bacterium]|nr:hypothetical protein [Desulfomonilaceae bacterium]
MARMLTLSAVLLVLTVFPAEGTGLNVTGNWEASVLGSTVKAQVRQEGHLIEGVAHVYTLFGAKDTYHFAGNINHGKIFASHNSGHTFSGSVTPDGRMVGTLKTRGGKRVGVNAFRK